MSGGYFNYRDSALREEIFGCDSSRPRDAFEDKEICELVWDVLDLIHDYDWYKSGDTCRETYLKKKREFKQKWFSNHEFRARMIIDEAVDRLRNELYETFVDKTEGK